MSKGTSLTFFDLFDLVDAIEIPILQRDYAQGRTAEFEVRTLFLNSLFDALSANDNTTRKSLDLDFVYGSFEQSELKVFSVLDGQQRLTTLFLLHWYLAVCNDRLPEFRERFVLNGQRSRFTYKTRPSTSEFFDAITTRNIATSTGNISKQISNSQWFYLSWQQDPTVQACLTMLDAIEARFSNCKDDLYERLINTTQPYVTFQFLDLDSFGLSDELYIKMNARGKPLTVFENFKAKLEQKIEELEGPWPEYQLMLENDISTVNGYEYFIHKIDKEWADLFWPYRNESSKDDTFDDELMNFIRLIITYQYLLHSRNSAVNLAKAKTELFGSQGVLRVSSLSRYEELGCITKPFVVRLIQILDLIYRDGLRENRLAAYLPNNTYYYEDGTFVKVLKNSANYEDKLRFFGFYSYLAKWSEPTVLGQWSRILYNLTQNTIINTLDEFYSALFSIWELCKSDATILATLTSDTNITGFSGAQVLEEKIKAHLILKSDDWYSVILESEQHPFLDGQIGCLLNFSGILGFYRENKNCDWTDESDGHYFERFSYYSKAIRAVFDLIQNNSRSIDYLWERAVLSKGEYFTEKSGQRFNLLSSWETKNNIDRDHSWKRLLRIGTSVIEQKQAYVKDVIDDPLFDVSSIKSSLAAICERALSDSNLQPWKKAFIKHKGLISYCNQGFIENSSIEFILLNESQRNHYHSELYTKILECELSESKNLIMPFAYISYDAVRSREERAYLKLSGFLLNTQRYSLEVRRNLSDFSLRFKGGDVEAYPNDLKTILENEGFQLMSFLPPCYECRVESPTNQVVEVQDKILSLCAKLREIK